MRDDQWPASNPLTEHQGVAFLMAIGCIVDPCVFPEGPALLRESVEEDSFEAVLTACVVAACASRLIPDWARERDYDEVVLQAGQVPTGEPGAAAASKMLHVIAKLNAGVNADPQPLLDIADPMTVAQVGIALTMGYLHVCADTLEVPVQVAAATLFNEVWELEVV